MSNKIQFLICLTLTILLPLCVSAANRWIDARFFPQAFFVAPAPQELSISTVCDPSLTQDDFSALKKIIPGLPEDGQISLRMAELFAADQADRLPSNHNWQEIEQKDAQRRVEVLDYLRQGLVREPRDLVYAAYIFQHGSCSEHYRFANRLAEIAVQAGYDDARWIYAATLDRYLMSLDQPQKYGTQYTLIDGRYQLYPVDPATTDEERRLYNVPPLSEAQGQAENSSLSGNVRKQILESWWLALVGSAFALLGAGLSLVRLPGRKPVVWVVVLVSLAFGLLSIGGHVIQVSALARDPQHLQRYAGYFWGLFGLGVALLAFMAFRARLSGSLRGKLNSGEV
jgi:hypothetical protein